jgi:hypothetical protein
MPNRKPKSIGNALPIAGIVIYLLAFVISLAFAIVAAEKKPAEDIAAWLFLSPLIIFGLPFAIALGLLEIDRFFGMFWIDLSDIHDFLSRNWRWIVGCGLLLSGALAIIGETYG